MRILIHDFGGYPFPVDLSRALARRGHTVEHAYCGSLLTTPHGVLTRRNDDPERLSFRSVDLSEPLDKFAFVKRWRQERAYGPLIAAEVDRFRPDLVVSADTPLDAQRTLLRHCKQRGIPFVFWVQDLIGLAAERLLREKIPVLGALVGQHYIRMERNLLRQSDAVVLITEDFRPVLRRYGVDADAAHVIENWGPLDAMPVRPKDNAWARAHGLVDKTCFLYSGTMGMKHNPDLLLQLALRFRDEEEIRIVVVSQGLGADWLAAQKAAHDLENLVLMGFQPFEQVPDVLGTADVLVAVLEPDAGAFSVPSKVLAYLCAARPVLLAVPPENLAAQIVTRHDAGLVAPPTDNGAFVRHAESLLDDPDQRNRFGQNARRYAETTFDIARITDAFEDIFQALPAPASRP